MWLVLLRVVIYMLSNKFAIIAIMATSMLLSCVAGCGTNNPENVVRNYLSICADVIKTGTVESRQLTEISNSWMNQHQGEQEKRKLNEFINEFSNIRQKGAIFDAAYDIESVSMQESTATVVAVLHMYMKYKSDEKTGDIRSKFNLSKNDRNEWKIVSTSDL